MSDKAQDEGEDDLGGSGGDRRQLVTIWFSRKQRSRDQCRATTPWYKIHCQGERASSVAEPKQGSGWVTLSGLVVTSAHVVAGQDETTVEDSAGKEYHASVVVFDPVRRPRRAPRPRARRAGPAAWLGRRRRLLGAVYGHPGGGPLRASSARATEEIVAVGTDIYRTGESQREVFVLASTLQSGDTGGAFVSVTGEVIGVAFAIDPDREGTSYALVDDEVHAVLETVDYAGVDTGACLVS